MVNALKPFVEILGEHARMRGHDACLVFSSVSLTWRDLDERSNRMARVMQASGVARQGERTARGRFHIGCASSRTRITRHAAVEGDDFRREHRTTQGHRPLGATDVRPGGAATWHAPGRCRADHRPPLPQRPFHHHALWPAEGQQGGGHEALRRRANRSNTSHNTASTGQCSYRP